MVDCVWYGSFADTPPRAGSCSCATRRPGRSTTWHLFTTDLAAAVTVVVERYAARWSTEPANAAGKQHLGVGRARNRLPKAVARTVPFGMLVQTLVIVWYTVAGYHPDDMDLRRQAEPWYDLKTEPSAA